MNVDIIKKKVIDYILKFKNKGFFIVFISNVVSKIASMLSQILIVRIISKYDYGVYVYSYNIYSLILLINGLGFSTAILQLCSEYNKDKNYSFSIFKYCIKNGLLFDFIVLIFDIGIVLCFNFKFQCAKLQLLLLSALPIFSYIYDCFTQYMRGNKRVLLFSYISILFAVCHCIFAVLGANIFNTIGLIVSYYISYIVVCIILAIYIYKEKYEIKEIKVNDKKFVWKFSFTNTINNAISQALFLLDVFVIGLVVSDSQILADYKVAITIPQALIFIPMSIITVVFPYFAENRLNINWLRKNYRLLLIFAIPMNLVISIFLYTFSNLIITVVFGTQYVGAVKIFRLFAINYFVQATFRFLSGNILASLRCYKFNLFNAVLCGILNVIFDFVLISRYGSMGAAYATIGIVAISSIISTVYLLHKLEYI